MLLCVCVCVWFFPLTHHSHIVYCLLFVIVNVKDQKASPAHPDPDYGPGVVTDIDPIGGPLATSMLRTIEFQQQEQS